jgi:cell division protein FtsB
MGEGTGNLKHWRKEILLAVLLLGLFAWAVSVGTVPDTQETTVEEQYQQLLDKTEQLEDEINKLNTSHDYANAVSEDLSERLARVEGRY